MSTYKIYFVKLVFIFALYFQTVVCNPIQKSIDEIETAKTEISKAFNTVGKRMQEERNNAKNYKIDQYRATRLSNNGLRSSGDCATNALSDPSFLSCMIDLMDVVTDNMCSERTRASMECFFVFLDECPALLPTIQNLTGGDFTIPTRQHYENMCGCAVQTVSDPAFLSCLVGMGDTRDVCSTSGRATMECFFVYVDNCPEVVGMIPPEARDTMFLSSEALDEKCNWIENLWQ